MIEINILKSRAHQWKMRRMLWQLVFLYLAGLFLILFSVGVQLMADNLIINRLQQDIRRIRLDLASEHGLAGELQRYRAELFRALSQLNLCRKEAESRLLWENKLVLLAKALPVGMWLGTLSTRQEGSDKDKETILVIKGFVSPAVNEKESIARFVFNLTQAGVRDFSSFTLKEVKREKKKDEETVSFIVEGRLRKGSGEKREETIK
ncbi:MAG TPA: hypothetical protein PKX93_04740 [bacterium]|nr:hypothetical protein [bacterium]HOL66749.1 hypothetical protein [bacterium]HPP12849.1 hypothetical protein [bacterium]